VAVSSFFTKQGPYVNVKNELYTKVFNDEMFCRLCMGRYAKALSLDYETICLKVTWKTLSRLQEVSPTTQKEMY